MERRAPWVSALPPSRAHSPWEISLRGSQHGITHGFQLSQTDLLEVSSFIQGGIHVDYKWKSNIFLCLNFWTPTESDSFLKLCIFSVLESQKCN